MKAFDEAAECPRCGHDEVAVHFTADNHHCYSERPPHPKSEHLHRRCERCGCTWVEACTAGGKRCLGCNRLWDFSDDEDTSAGDYCTDCRPVLEEPPFELSGTLGDAVNEMAEAPQPAAAAAVGRSYGEELEAEDRRWASARREPAPQPAEPSDTRHRHCVTCGHALLEYVATMTVHERVDDPSGAVVVPVLYRCANCGAMEAPYRRVEPPPVEQVTFGFDAPRAPTEFVECATCHAKPGAPELCGSCLHNRSAIALLNRQLGDKCAPIPMRLHCPLCHELHVDQGTFATKPHRDHVCQHCGHVWRPALVPTVGVQFLPGYKDE
jgi:hypothetical protein